jgi:hypothetical protein
MASLKRYVIGALYGTIAFVGLLFYMRNVPGQLIINLIPRIVSAGLFSMWVLSAEPYLTQSLEPKA